MIDTIVGLNAFDIDAIKRSRGYLVIFPGGRMLEASPAELKILHMDVRRAVKWEKQTVQQFADELFSRSKNVMISTIY